MRVYRMSCGTYDDVEEEGETNVVDDRDLGSRGVDFVL